MTMCMHNDANADQYVLLRVICYVYQLAINLYFAYSSCNSKSEDLRKLNIPIVIRRMKISEFEKNNAINSGYRHEASSVLGGRTSLSPSSDEAAAAV